MGKKIAVEKAIRILREVEVLQGQGSTIGGRSGMRRGELIALKWGDINWDDSTVHVRRSLHKGKFIPPKSRRSVRSIVMSSALKSALRERWITRRENQHDLVFISSIGEPLDPDSLVRREFHPALSRSELRRIRFHDLRHTDAALLISQGENIKFIQHRSRSPRTC